MQDKQISDQKVHWLIDSKEDHEYETTTWFRCMGIEDFVNKIKKNGQWKIVGIIFEGNNIGFILE